MSTRRELARVRAAARARVDAQERFEQSLRDAVAGGSTLRAIAVEAGITHGRVAQIVGPVGRKGSR